MNENKYLGAQKRIDFLGRWALAFFAVLVVLTGWLGNSIRTGEYDTMFRVGVGGAIAFAIVCICFAWIAHRHIERLEESDNE